MTDASDAQQWIRVAEEDLLAVRSILSGEKVAWGVVCFLSQQAGEKLLKAFLAERKVPIRKIHDLRALLGECLQVDPSLGDLATDCKLLTPHWIRSRYPDDAPYIAAEEDGRKMIAAAERIRVRLLPLITQ